MRTVELITSRRFVGFCVGVMVVYMYGWCTNWTFHPSYRPFATQDYFFTAQADALLHGRLWVDPMSLRPGQSDECWFVAGRCYGYFGLTPSLLRIPILLVFGASTSSFAPIMIPLAAGLAFGASLDLCRQLAKPMLHQPRGAVFMCIAAITLGPGSVLVFLADPYVYQEAIIWSIAGIALAINFYWRWLNNKVLRLLVFSVLCCALAAGARPSSLLVGAVLGIALLVMNRGHLGSRHDIAVAAIGFIILPILFSVGVFFVKFSHPTPPWNSYRNPTGIQKEPLSGPCNLAFQQHPKYMPTALLAYLRPDAFRLWGEWPYVRFRFAACIGPTRPTYVWPLREGEMYVEKTGSLSNTMPLALIATGVVLVASVRRRRSRELTLLVAAATVTLGATTVVAITSRYLGEFYPLLSVGLALSASLLGSIERKSFLYALTCLALVLAPWSLLANASLFTRYGWIFLS